MSAEEKPLPEIADEEEHKKPTVDIGSMPAKKEEETTE